MAGSSKSKPDWSHLHGLVHRTLRSRPHLLPTGEALLVAVSGGQDSVCLLKLLVDLRSQWGWHLAVAHCDHQMRSDSADNAQHVRELAERYDLPFYQKTATTALKSEADARSWRYQALIEIAESNAIAHIVTGHTQSDRAETLLYNLIRGSGSDGLSSLWWQRPLSDTIQLVRPLLNVQRRQTGSFCQQFQLPIWEDSTNREIRYTRNRIRLQLIPELENINPQVQTHLANTAELLRADIEYLEASAGELYAQAAIPNSAKLDRTQLARAPLALQRRVIRQFLLHWLPQSPNFEHIEKTLHLIHAPNRSQTDPFPGGYLALVNHPWIELQPKP